MNETKMQLNQLNIELNNKHKIFKLDYIEYTRGKFKNTYLLEN